MGALCSSQQSLFPSSLHTSELLSKFPFSCSTFYWHCEPYSLIAVKELLWGCCRVWKSYLWRSSVQRGAGFSGVVRKAMVWAGWVASKNEESVLRRDQCCVPLGKGGHLAKIHAFEPQYARKTSQHGLPHCLAWCGTSYLGLCMGWALGGWFVASHFIT